MKYNYLVLMAIAFLLSLILFGCKKYEQETFIPKITEEKVEATATFATFTWTVDWQGKLISVVEVSDNEDMSHSQIYGSETETDNPNFTVTVTNLKEAKKYYYRYIVWNHHYVDNKFVMEVKSFTTETDLPKVKVLEVTDITRTSALGQGEVLSDGGLEITEHGICWGTNHNPTTSGSHAASSQNTTTYFVPMNDLTPEETYYVRAYAKNAKGTGYSEEEMWFVTGDAVPPTVTTAQVTDISWRMAIGGGEVTNDGDAMVTERGVCWNTSENPTVENNHASSGTGTGSFTTDIIGLTAGTTYHVRAYAKNRAGYGYGGDVVFKTSDAVAPTVTTANPTDITRTAAVCGGEVISDGGSDITERGVCWGTDSNPSNSGNHIAAAQNGTGSFTVQITGLTPNTSYYVCSYATNSVGASYGTPKSFATLPVGKPTVTTTQVSNITTTSATGGGNVTDDGGAGVTERGICWGTEHNPTLADCVGNAHSGMGMGSFALNMTGLTQNTKYYVRAYARNNIDTGYGDEVEFTTNVQNYTIATVANPVDGGVVTGNGTYQQGQSCTVSATENIGYRFVSWTENGDQVSDDASYTFTVNGNRTLVASFEIKPNQYVSTEPSNRNVVLEMFTGRNSGYCPDGHRIANEIAAANPERFWAVNIHAGGFAPTSYPNFNTSESTTIYGGFNVPAFPMGVVNRSTENAQSREVWAGLANQQISQPSECNIGGKVIVNPSTRIATITVEVYYTGNSSSNQNYLTVAMLQDSILGSQADYGNYNPTQWIGNQYCHMHILRDIITESTWGDVISPTTQGTLISRTYQYQIPEIIGNPNGAVVNLNNIYFLAWVSERYQGSASRPILNANKLILITAP